jgi:hypothetical protein
MMGKDVEIRDAKRFSKHTTRKFHADIRNVAVSSQGRSLFVATSGKRGVGTILPIDRIGQPVILPGFYSHAEFSYDGQQLVACIRDRVGRESIELRDVATGELAQSMGPNITLAGEQDNQYVTGMSVINAVNPVRALRIAPDGRFVAIVIPEGLLVWTIASVTSDRNVRFYGLGDHTPTAGLAISADSRLVAVGCTSTGIAKIQIVNVESGVSYIATPEQPHRDWKIWTPICATIVIWAISASTLLRRRWTHRKRH